MLHDREEPRADRLFKGKQVATGLVIDDFYVVSVQPSFECPAASAACQRFRTAMQAYDNHEMIGSTEKDVTGAEKAKLLWPLLQPRDCPLHMFLLSWHD